MVILRSADEFLVRTVSLAGDSFGVNCCLTGFEDDAVSVSRADLSLSWFEGILSYTGRSIERFLGRSCLFCEVQTIMDAVASIEAPPGYILLSKQTAWLSHQKGQQ